MLAQETPDSVHHRGCGIRAASYSIGPHAWLPEACVWLRTETGLRRVWVHSFAHCFDAEKLTFPSKLDADGWALGAARIIIDRALEQWKATPKAPPEPAESWTRRWRLGSRTLQALRRIKQTLPR